MKRSKPVTGERCLMFRDRPREKKAFDDDDDANMVVIAETAAAAPNPPKTDLRLSRKRKCDSKAVQDGDDKDENWPPSMASSYKGSKGQPSKRTRSNMQPKVRSCLLAQFMPR